MNLENLSPRTKKVLLVILLAVVIIGMTVIFIVFGSRSGNQFGNEVVIKNYRENVKNLSADYEDLFMAELYKVIKLNTPEGQEVPTVKDAMIRDNSATQEYVRTANIYRGNFTVDIESLKQSYAMTYSYSTDPNSPALGGYPVLASCLPIPQLKYGDFNCKDLTSEENGDIDPIVEYLPYSTLEYSVRSVESGEGKVDLIVTLFLTQADRRSGEAAAVATYKTKVEEWITSIGFNPADYEITYNH